MDVCVTYNVRGHLPRLMTLQRHKKIGKIGEGCVVRWVVRGPQPHWTCEKVCLLVLVWGSMGALWKLYVFHKKWLKTMLFGHRFAKYVPNIGGGGGKTIFPPHFSDIGGKGHHPVLRPYIDKRIWCGASVWRYFTHLQELSMCETGYKTHRNWTFSSLNGSLKGQEIFTSVRELRCNVSALHCHCEHVPPQDM